MPLSSLTVAGLSFGTGVESECIFFGGRVYLRHIIGFSYIIGMGFCSYAAFRCPPTDPVTFYGLI